MKVLDLFEYTAGQDEHDTTQGMYDPTDDEYNLRLLNDTRKKRLTLKKLNRLKKIRAVKKLEALKRQKLLGVIYGNPKKDDSGGPF